MKKVLLFISLLLLFFIGIHHTPAVADTPVSEVRASHILVSTMQQAEVTEDFINEVMRTKNNAELVERLANIFKVK